jgi:hypothetical protein
MFVTSSPSTRVEEEEEEEECDLIFVYRIWGSHTGVYEKYLLFSGI